MSPVGDTDSEKTFQDATESQDQEDHHEDEHVVAKDQSGIGVISRLYPGKTE